MIPKLNFNGQSSKAQFNQTAVVRGADLIQKKQSKKEQPVAPSGRKKFVLKKAVGSSQPPE